MMERKPPPPCRDRRRATSASAFAARDAVAAPPPFLQERRVIESILRAEAAERSSPPPASAERSALDCLERLLESLDSGEGVERAVAEARATLERSGRDRPSAAAAPTRDEAGVAPARRAHRSADGPA